MGMDPDYFGIANVFKTDSLVNRIRPQLYTFIHDGIEKRTVIS